MTWNFANNIAASKRREDPMFGQKLIFGVIVVSILGTGCTGDPTQTDEYLQLQSEMAELEAERDAALATADEAESDLALVRAEVVSIEGELTEANARLQSGEESLDRLAAAVEHVVAYDLWIDPTFVDELVALGLDISMADQIVADRGWAESWRDYVEDRGFDAVERTRRPVGSRELDDGWTVFLATPEGSDEELVALWDYTIRLLAVTQGRLDEARSR